MQAETRMYQRFLWLSFCVLQLHPAEATPGLQQHGMNILPNSAISLASIGSTDEDALLCVTDAENCCSNSNSIGWFYPDETKIDEGSSSGSEFWSTYGDGVIRLHFSGETNRSLIEFSSGIFECSISSGSGSFARLTLGIMAGNDSMLRAESIDFSLRTDIDEEPPMFTLTCSSVGGPVISMRWTRNNESLPLASMDLQDRITARYSGVSEVISDRAFGVYACTVSNNIISSTVYLNVQEVIHPDNIYGYTNSNASLTISWTPSSCTPDTCNDTVVTAYRVLCDKNSDITEEFTVAGNETSYVIGDALSGDVYRCIVQALTNLLPSLKSFAVTITSDLTVLPVTPTITLVNLTSSSSVEIHWDYPGGQFEDLSFSVTALYHGPCPESVPPFNVPVPSPDERSIVVQNLEAHSMYSFVLSAVNSAGSSAIESAMIHTLPSVPDMAPSLELVETGTTYLTVNISDNIPCLRRNSEIIGYTVAVDGIALYNLSSLPPEQHLVFNITDLAPNSNYQIQIAAANSERNIGTFGSSLNQQTRFGIGFRLRGRFLPDNSYINYDEIGTGNSSLHCLTDLVACCKFPNLAGEWFYPNGSLVPISARNRPLYRNRENDGSVRLHRRGKGPAGKYRCELRDSSSTYFTLVASVYRESEVAIYLPEKIHFQLTSSFEDPVPSFTLFTISTNGPVDTATWELNGLPLPNDTVQSSVPYQDHVIHSLTVTGRLVGTYQLTVRNGWPSVTSKSALITEPVVPRTLNVTQTGPQSLTVSWDTPQPDASISGYIVYMDDVTVSGRVSTIEQFTSGSVSQVSIGGLRIGGQYNISLLTLSLHLPGSLVTLDRIVEITLYVNLTEGNSGVFNNSYVTKESVSTQGLSCLTNQLNCCSQQEGSAPLGNWYDPSGNPLPVSSSNGVYQTHGPGFVRLNAASSNIELMGIYQCTIADNIGPGLSAYVGIFDSSSGGIDHVEMDFTLLTSPNATVSVFLLTCTSIGGPVRDVSWTMDPESIRLNETEIEYSESSHHLVDSNAARYRHEVTITGRVLGRFVCTVSNNKPSSNSTSLDVQMALPAADLSADLLSPTSALLEWTPPLSGPEVTGFTVYVQSGLLTVQELNVSDGDSMRAILENLVLKSYTVQVFSRSGFFHSVPVTLQLVFSVATPDVSLSRTELGTVYTNSSLAFLCHVTLNQVITDTLAVITLTSPNRPILSVNTSAEQSSILQRFTIEGADLSDSGEYTCSVQVIVTVASFVHDSGAGNNSLVINIVPVRAPSAPPSNFVAVVNNSRTVTLRWSPPQLQEQNGPITSYHISCVSTNSSRRSEISQSLDHGSREVIVSSLIPGSEYNCFISASTAEGEGPTDSIRVVTPADATLFQLNFKITEKCPIWLRINALKTAELITNIVKGTNGRCMGCNVTSEEFPQAAFICNGNDVTFRALFSSQSDLTSEQFLLLVEDWISDDGAVTVGNLQLQADAQCSVVLDSSDDLLCGEEGRVGETVLVGISLSLVIVIILVLVCLVAVLLVACRTKGSVKRERIESAAHEQLQYIAEPTTRERIESAAHEQLQYVAEPTTRKTQESPEKAKADRESAYENLSLRARPASTSAAAMELKENVSYLPTTTRPQSVQVFEDAEYAIISPK